MLAADHRWQWEEFCDARSLPRERIRDAKRVAYEGFVRAREQSAAARQFGALLIDEQYSSAVIADALKAGLAVGTPAEKAGAIPLAWATDPFSAALTGAFVKVLARYRRDDKAETLAEQWAKLEALQAWCRGQGKPLVLEVLVARKDEPEDEFESSGRPAMLAEFIAEAYRRGLTPEFWKIEGTLSAAGRPHDRHSDCRAPIVPADHPRESRRISRQSIAGSARAPPAPPRPASPSGARSSGSLRPRSSKEKGPPPKQPRISPQPISR